MGAPVKHAAIGNFMGSMRTATPKAVAGKMTVTDAVRSRADIARRVRVLADKRQREAARSSRRRVRDQLTAIATNYRALADELERAPARDLDAPAITPTLDD
jgi:hypothetical protein